MNGQRYIAIEGPIGVGKTTLARLLAQRLGAELIRETVEENPFLASFYKDPKRFAFQTQLFFLLSRYKHQEALAQQQLFAGGMIADSLFDKDLIFAQTNLSDDDLALYQKLYDMLDRNVVRPNLVVYLQANPETLLERIRTRGHDFERSMSESYLKALVHQYNQYFFHYSKSPLLVVNTTDFDVRHEEDFGHLFHEIVNMRGGVKYYLPQPA